MQPIAEQPPLSAGWRRGWGLFFRAVRPHAHRPRRRLAQPDLLPAIDPIALTIMAVNRLGPATFRAVASGMPVTVAAPDERTADIFRAALSQMGHARPTDRLVSVELVETKAATR
jgi:hypothetical protein